MVLLQAMFTLAIEWGEAQAKPGERRPQAAEALGLEWRHVPAAFAAR